MSQITFMFQPTLLEIKLSLQLHIAILYPAEAFHHVVEEKTEDSRSNEIESDDFGKEKSVIGSGGHGVPTTQGANQTRCTHTRTGCIVRHP